MAIRRRRSRSSFDAGLLFGWIGAFVAVAILVVAGIGLMRLRGDLANRDSVSLCTTKNPAAITALLFDSSDSLSALQQIKVRQILDATLQTVAKGERVDVYMATAEAGQLARPLFSKCNPAAVEGATGLSENPERMLELRRTQFVQPLEHAIEKALQAKSRKTSPILETIAAASVQSYGRASTGYGPRRGTYRLVVVSDFLQNSDVLTHYKAFPDVNEFSSMAGWVSTLASLNGVSTNMIYINRPGSLRFQNNKHRIWWCEYLIKRGATACEIEQL